MRKFIHALLSRHIHPVPATHSLVTRTCSSFHISQGCWALFRSFSVRHSDLPFGRALDSLKGVLVLLEARRLHLFAHQILWMLLCALLLLSTTKVVHRLDCSSPLPPPPRHLRLGIVFIIVVHVLLLSYSSRRRLRFACFSARLCFACGPRHFSKKVSAEFCPGPFTPWFRPTTIYTNHSLHQPRSTPTFVDADAKPRSTTHSRRHSSHHLRRH